MSRAHLVVHHILLTDRPVLLENGMQLIGTRPNVLEKLLQFGR
uniref:Uncharacterized protein n=1 Tax=Arundo donax TaxID=35708 RepID=A0A0A9CJW3_ARUDO